MPAATGPKGNTPLPIDRLVKVERSRRKSVVNNDSVRLNVGVSKVDSVNGLAPIRYPGDERLILVILKMGENLVELKRKNIIPSPQYVIIREE